MIVCVFVCGFRVRMDGNDNRRRIQTEYEKPLSKNPIFLFFFFSYSSFHFFSLLLSSDEFIICLNWTRYESSHERIRSYACVLRYLCSCSQVSHGEFPSAAAAPPVAHSSVNCSIAYIYIYIDIEEVRSNSFVFNTNGSSNVGHNTETKFTNCIEKHAATFHVRKNRQYKKKSEERKTEMKIYRVFSDLAAVWQHLY